MGHRLGWLLVAAMILGFAGYGPPARAQDDDLADEEQPAPPRHVLFASDEQFEQWFDVWIFGRGTVHNGRVVAPPHSADRLREEFDAQLVAKLHDLGRRHKLTAEERKKLRIAGKRDIQRYFDAVEETKDRLRAVRDDRVQFLAILNQRQRNFLVRRQGGENIFGEGSLLAKTLKTTLANHPAAEAPGRAHRARDGTARETYRSCVEGVVSRLDDRLGLTGQQHRRFVDVIFEETSPLERYGAYDARAVMFQAARMRKPSLERILNRNQILVLHDVFQEARLYEKVLIADGYLARDDSDENRPVAEAGAKRKAVDARNPRPALIRRGFTGRE